MDPKNELTCESCGGKFEGAIIECGTVKIRRRECPECLEKRRADEEEAEKRERARAIADVKQKWRSNSGIPFDLEQKTFDTFNPKFQKVALEEVGKWTSGFDISNPLGYPSLILCSDKPGVGKTHLMRAIVNEIIDRWDGKPESCPTRSIRFESGPGMVRRVRSTFNLPPGSNHEREEDVYNNLRGVRLLLLDDVGKEKPSDFTREIYWFIIDERVKKGLPVVISSRIPLEPGEGTLEELMGVDTVDRLYGMTQGKILKFTGESYRRKMRVA